VNPKQSHVDWLSRCGYLPPPDPQDSKLQTEEGRITDAIRVMQRFGGLPETGQLDDATIKLMDTPRCSLPDIVGKEDMMKRRRRRKRWSPYGQKGQCEAGWVKFGCSCYFFSGGVKSWDDSRKECQKTGSDLVIVNSLEEQEFLVKSSKEWLWGLWIGLTYAAVENEWIWIDGSRLSTPFWFGGDGASGENREPNGHDEHCVDIYAGFNHPVNRWADGRCDHLRYWICEKGM